MRRPKKFPKPNKPSLPAQMTFFEGLQGLSRSKTNPIDFWTVGLASIETEATSDDHVGWIQDGLGIGSESIRLAALPNVLCCGR